MKTYITLLLAFTYITAPIVLADQIPSVVRGTYRVAGQIKDRHGYIYGNNKGSLSCSTYHSSGIKIVLSTHFARALIFLTPSGHYRVVANGSSNVVSRSGRWITYPNLLPGKISTTFQFSGQKRKNRDIFFFIANETGNYIYADLMLKSGVIFYLRSRIR